MSVGDKPCSFALDHFESIDFGFIEGFQAEAAAYTSDFDYF